jgi:hypothetical protein
MPIEVRELVIKASITQDSTTGASPPRLTANNAVPPNEEIIKACVEKILEILKEKMER